ncbi:phytanoyl-CoA dioxygenase family protein [Catalinimonas alkaloidigena]|uniref:phytanoyl-CoA dioxygenase family protein n=1 Tax=Catalinimonas alkaloidigena TaxID=1075417 RepID=UPI001C409909|nr:phytanoyl-CoA dioxygenase family protein [Catalinimonas alkaloidigena]
MKEAQAAYRKYGLKKSVYTPVSHQEIKKQAISEEAPWLDQPNATERLLSQAYFQQLPAAWQDAVRQWPERGYLILKGLFSAEEVETINREIDRLVHEQKAEWRYVNKIMFAVRQSKAVRDIVHKPELEALLGFLLGKPVKLFQSINFLKGSQQSAHSDSIHMTTYPLGYMIAAWIALEDIDPGSGPLFYYPGSHRLPYVLNEDFDHGGNYFLIGEQAYARYEAAIKSVLEKQNLPQETFLAQKGDVLLWHANLLHGGSPVLDPQRTRKSMVLHYFAEGVICYHEITQRPALQE